MAAGVPQGDVARVAGIVQVHHHGREHPRTTSWRRDGQAPAPATPPTLGSCLLCLLRWLLLLLLLLWLYIGQVPEGGRQQLDILVDGS